MKKTTFAFSCLLSLVCALHLLAGCSSAPKQDVTTDDPKPTTIEMMASTAPTIVTLPPPQSTVDHSKIDQAKIDAKLAPVKQAVENVKNEVNHKKETLASGTEPATALKWLKNGNVRFTKGYLRKDGVDKKTIAKLVLGQRPHSVVVSCSDSRVPPELVFDQKLGEIYVVRTASAALEPVTITSIEHAVEQLNARNIVLLGNKDCSLVKNAPQELASRSEILAKRFKSGEVKITAALYNLSTGIVDFE